MTDSNDISKLFKHIGVSGADYQEINKQNGARDSQSRWPLLNSLHAQANRAPSVDTRRRFNMETEQNDAQPAGAPADDALFTHIATDDVVQAHEQVATSVTQAADVDRRASNAAMAAVDAAPPPAEAAPDKQIAPKTAEFIAPRANLLSGHLRPSAHRAPFDPSSMDGPVTGRPVPKTAPASPITPASSPIYTEPVASTPAATPSAQPRPATVPAAIGGLFARLAHPEGPPTDAPTEPEAQAAPVSLFDRLIRS